KRGKARAVARPLTRLRRFEPALDFFEPARRHEAVVGSAENLLHLLDRGINLVPKRIAEAARENLHRVTKLLANDTHAMEILVVLQVLSDGSVQIVHQAY